MPFLQGGNQVSQADFRMHLREKFLGGRLVVDGQPLHEEQLSEARLDLVLQLVLEPVADLRLAVEPTSIIPANVQKDLAGELQVLFVSRVALRIDDHDLRAELFAQ